MTEKKKLSWRCKNIQQQRDKSEIYNSREWRELRIRKLRANPLCERCQEQGYIVSAHVVHHLVPIESATTKDEMRRLALHCGLGGLQSLCDRCHAEVHKEQGSKTSEAVKRRADERQARWEDAMERRFNLLIPGVPV